jgi:hypothetical protein
MNDQQILMGLSAQQQREQYLKTLHLSTSQQVYAKLAAMIYQGTMMAASQQANPMGLDEPTEDFKPVIEIGELMAAAQFSKLAATAYMVGLGELKPEALKQYQR